MKNGVWNKWNQKTKSSVRPISILLDANQPERYKIETGSMRRLVMVGFGGVRKENQYLSAASNYLFFSFFCTL